MEDAGAVTVTLRAHQGRSGTYIKAVVYGTHSGRYRSEAVVLMPCPAEALPLDPEELITVALQAVAGAVYCS